MSPFIRQLVMNKNIHQHSNYATSTRSTDCNTCKIGYTSSRQKQKIILPTQKDSQENNRDCSL